jgi:hypothetical protein
MGMLLFYVNRRQPLTYEAFTKLVDGQLKRIILK